MTETEEYFPRGGKKPTETYFKQSGNFLGAAEKGERKKKKPKKKSEGDDGYLSDEAIKEVDQSYKNCAYGISYKIAKPGTLILGRVKHAFDTKVIFSLPCRMQGTVMACHISEPYNKLLEAYVNDQADNMLALSKMFKPGQYVAVKVLEAEPHNLMLTCMPHHVNSGRTSSDLHKGALLQAAVSSIEDHGYVLDIGIPETRAFLPKTNANPELELHVGILIWCTVKSSSEGVVTLTNELVALQQGFSRHKTNAPLLPGTALDFTVDTPLENGIEGHVFGEVTAYIQRQHADRVKGKKPNLGQKIRARVLYVMPTRNTPFLTMKGIFESTLPDLRQEQQLEDGQIIEDAKVLKITGRSIHFLLGGGGGTGCFGTMSLKRVRVDEDLSDEQVLAKSYPIGSTHKVRVICYNMSDFAYSVSDEARVLHERYFTAAGLRPGDLVQAEVKQVAEAHLLVTLGRLTGVVPHTHVTDAGVYVDPKKATTSKLTKKFKVGQEVKARVLSVDVEKSGLILTMKPTLLATDLDLLSSYEQAEIGKGYTGVIKYIRDYVLVSFFNNVVAFVPRGYVTKDPIDNLFDAFHIGQIVTCTILKVDVENKKMTGSLTTVPFWPNKKRDPVKRKHNPEDTDVPNKKRKNSDKQTDVEEESTDAPVKSKKKNKKAKEKKIVSEESDEIETDIYEDSDQALTPIDKGLIDFSDCITPEKYKKRVVSLIKNIKARERRMNRLDNKISTLEAKGLDAKNKIYHTAMHTEKLLIEQRMKKLLEALNIGQEKWKEMEPQYRLDRDAKRKEAKRQKAIEKKALKAASKEDKPEPEVKAEPEVKVEVKEKKKKKKEKVVESLEPVLDVPSVKEFWSANAVPVEKTVQAEESSSSEDEEKDQPKKKRKKLSVAEKLAKARDEEERVREMERRATESEAQPRSSEQFQRALLASPDCSQLWIAYMAFHLQATEIEKARAVGRKALNTISFREEQEKLNVWLAMINFENRFGTKESQQKTLEEALQMNDTYKVHSKLLDIYVETGKHQELSSLVDLMMRKYKRDPNTYIQCGGACFKLALVDKARHVMQKALTVLEKKEHVSVLVQFALLERTHGARERAEALFEQVLAVYPQRVDVCAAYIDMIMKNGDIEHVRQVMERMTSQKIPARKMKVLYKKWIEVEEKNGNQDKVESIRQRAMEYIEKAKF